MPYIRERELRAWRKELEYLRQFEVPRPDQAERIEWLVRILEGGPDKEDQ